MNRETQEPRLVKKDDLFGDKYERPAFATIGASRVSGQANLFGSNIGQQGFVMVEIHEAALYRESHQDRIQPSGRSIVRLYMTEAQWVGFVSRMNIGNGVPCTLDYVPEGPRLDIKPHLPPQEKAADHISEIADRIAESNRRKVRDGVAKINELCEGLPAKKRDAIMQAVCLMSQHLKVNHEHAENMLTEHKEKLIVEAKVEIEAMVSGLCNQLGVESLQQIVAAAKLPQLPQDGA